MSSAALAMTPHPPPDPLVGCATVGHSLDLTALQTPGPSSLPWCTRPRLHLREFHAGDIEALRAIADGVSLNLDTVQDFVVADDTVWLENAIFTAPAHPPSRSVPTTGVPVSSEKVTGSRRMPPTSFSASA